MSLLFYFFLWKILSASNGDPYQTPHGMASDLDLHFLPMAPVRIG